MHANSYASRLNTVLLVAASTIALLTAAANSDAQSTDTTGQSAYRGSIGESLFPLTNYSVTQKTITLPNGKTVPVDDYEEPHNYRVEAPYEKLIPTLKPDIPLHVRPHSRDVLSDIEDRPFFDYNGWQTFIGLIWPAKAYPDTEGSYHRGIPERTGNTKTDEDYFRTSYHNGTHTKAVFETLRLADTLFPGATADGKQSGTTGVEKPDSPPHWFSTPYQAPFTLSDTDKAADILDEAFSGPLVDQNLNYVRYNEQVNRVFYDFIRTNGYYWKGNLPKAPSPVSIPPLDVPPDWCKEPSCNPEGPLTLVLQPQTNTTVIQRVHGDSITIKTAWRIMEPKDTTVTLYVKNDEPPVEHQIFKDDLTRYYTTTALVDILSEDDQGLPVLTKEEKTVGLVGMHVVVRTTQFPQGLWSSFGHVDNLQPPSSEDQPTDVKRASFNSGTDFIPRGYSYLPEKLIASKNHRPPVEVSRIWKIPDTPVAKSKHMPEGVSTVGMNQAYQRLLKGTVWENYQLEITQWPTDPGSFYAKPFLQMRGLDKQPGNDQPIALHQIYDRNKKAQSEAYPRWSGLPIPQVGALNPVLETYFQNKPGDPLESTSCMGCHYSASDLGYVWVFKLGTSPSPYQQGRVNPMDSDLASKPARPSMRYMNNEKQP